MKLWTLDQWSETAKARTDNTDDADVRDGVFVGVAIGPQSDEGRCLIDGELLQAGRPLPLRARHFNVELVRPISVQDTLNVRTLQLALIEDPSELAIVWARANGEHSAKVVTNGADFATLITVPFVGRRQARFQLVTAAGSVSYRVFGLRYHGSTRTVKATLLTEQLAVAPDTDDTVAFYIGGTNEAECWDALRVDVDTDAASTVHVDVETIGEIGAR